MCVHHYLHSILCYAGTFMMGNFLGVIFRMPQAQLPPASCLSGTMLPQCQGRDWWSSMSGASWFSGSMCDIQARDHGFDPWLRWICSDGVLLGKALRSHMLSLDPGVCGYLVGQWRLVCLNSSVCWKWQPGCMLPGELRWLMNEQVLSPGSNLWSWANGASC